VPAQPRPRAQSALLLLLVLAVVAAPGCQLHKWGPSDGKSRQYSGTREIWEVPSGVIVTPVGFAIDLCATLTVTAISLGLLPVNFVLVAADEDPLIPSIFVLAGTSSGLTLLNPSCNLSWAWTRPEGGVIRILDVRDPSRRKRAIRDQIRSRDEDRTRDDDGLDE
jgi:hypothetical protein